MKRINLLSLTGIFILVFQSIVFAQKPPVKPGKVTMDELTMKTCPLDSNACAMIICDFGKSYINYTDINGFQLYYDRFLRIKIFTKEGYSWADHSIPLYKDGSNKERITSLKACTFNLEDGKIVKEKLKNSDIYSEERSRHTEVKKFSLPDVKEGSVLEIEYTVQSDFFFNLNTWYFQYDIPALWSEYNTFLPEYFDYKRTMNGYIDLAENKSTVEQKSVVINSKERSDGYVTKTTFNSESVKYKEYRDHWVAKDVPAFIEEEPLTSRENYISKIQYELAAFKPSWGSETSYTRTWEDINDLLLEDEDFGKQLNGGGFLKDAAEAIEATGADEMGKVSLAYVYVRDRMKWNEKNGLFVDDNLRTVHERQSGNSAEVNLTLVLLLKRLDIEADPVAISTRSNGIISPAQPTISNFNYVLASAVIDGKTCLMDATDPDIPFGMLPERDLNGNGRVISDKRSGWISLDTELCDKSFWMYTLSIDDDLRFTGTVQASFDDYAAYKNRKVMQSFGCADEYVKAVQDYFPGLSITGHELVNAEDCSEAFKQKFDVTIADNVEGSPDLIFFNPMLYEAITENPFKLEKREYPVEFAYPKDKSCMVIINIPEGYKVEEVPVNAMVKLPGEGGSFMFSSSQVGNSLQIVSKIKITKKTFLPSDYQYLKEFYGYIMSKHAEPVVLSKQ